jgi:hypothetical protein
MRLSDLEGGAVGLGIERSDNRHAPEVRFEHDGLVALFIVIPIVELYVIIQIGSLIGVWPTIALLLAGAVFGSLLLRHQGRSAWRRFNAASPNAVPRPRGRRRAADRGRRHPAADPGLRHRHSRRDLPDPTDPGASAAPCCAEPRLSP